MSDASRNGRLPLIIIAVVVGILIGAALGLYAAYAILPPDLVLRDGSPRYLRYDPTGNSVQYRDYYVARVAQRFAAGNNSDPAWQEAQAALGITTGDTTPLEALKMVRDAEQAASNENKTDVGSPDAGRFTLADENNMRSLGDRLDQTKDQQPAVPQSVVDARRNVQIFGLLAIVLLAIFLLGLLFLVLSLLARAATPLLSTIRTTTSSTSRRVSDQAAVTLTPAARVNDRLDELVDDLPEDDTIIEPTLRPDLSQTEPGGAYVAPRATSPVAGEVLINTFSAAYRHGMDRYDEGFQISAQNGDLVGECGASIAHRYGIDNPARVVALTIWVFDKNDFQSTSKVLATPFALRTDSIKRELESRGELVQARPGLFEVLTSTLRVEVEVLNLALQPIESQSDGYFDNVDLTFRVYQRS